MYSFLSRVFARFGDEAASRRYKEKSEAIRRDLFDKLWDEDNQWMKCLYPDGHEELVYSIQMFDLLNIGVLNEEQSKAVIARVNRDEFLSEHGPHSVSKADKQHFDIGDIDWSGGGCYTGDACNLIESLFLAGAPEKAWETAQAVLWWTDKYPYWPQAIFATKDDYSHFERANIVTAFSFAQAIVFGMFGLHVENGRLVQSPNLPVELKGARLTNIR